jgi:pimeloyl-ACP methyl ester carboxylesterase
MFYALLATLLLQLVGLSFASTKPRILLVHGALADGSSWSKIIPILQDHGYYVTAVQQPLMSIPGDIAVVKTAIATLNQESNDPILVVGHSFGGVVMTNAATGLDNLHGLVYVQAIAPKEGETVAELAAMFPALPSNKMFIADTDGRVRLSRANFVKYFDPDLPEKEARDLAAVQGPFNPEAFNYTSGPPAWKDTTNLHCIVGTADQIISPQLEEFMGKRIGAKITVLEGASHVGLISHHRKVAQVILDAASRWSSSANR